MSLINQVLRDLDHHTSPEGDDSVNTAEITAFPKATATAPMVSDGYEKWALSAAIIFALVIITLIAWQYQSIKKIENGLVEISLTLPILEKGNTNPLDQITGLTILNLPDQIIKNSRRAESSVAAVELPNFTGRRPQRLQNESTAAATNSVDRTSREVAYLPLIITEDNSVSSSRRVQRPVAAERPPSLSQAKKISASSKPKPVRSSYQKARGLLSNGRLAEAESVLRDTLDKNSSHMAARELLAGLLMRGGRNAEAEGLLDVGLVNSPNSAGLALLKARLLSAKGDDSNAISLLERTLPKGDGALNHFATLGALYQKQNDHVKAVQNYQAVLSIDPMIASAWVGAGISLESLGRNKQAMGAFERAMNSRDLTAVLNKYIRSRITVLAKEG